MDIIIDQLQYHPILEKLQLCNSSFIMLSKIYIYLAGNHIEERNYSTLAYNITKMKSLKDLFLGNKYYLQ